MVILRSLAFDKPFLLLLFIFLLSFSSKAQDSEVTVENKQWNIHKTEIGLDIQFLNRNLNLNSIGSNLIFKRHIGEKKFISKNEKRALRLQLGGSGTQTIGVVDSVETGSLFNDLDFNEEKFVNVRALVGIEFQKQIKRLQLYYGFDTGVAFFEQKRVDTITFFTNSGQFIGFSTEENQSFGIPLYLFAGLKFFIHPRFSIGIESAFTTGFNWVSYERVRFNDQLEAFGRPAAGKKKEINFGTDYLRYLNVNFHF